MSTTATTNPAALFQHWEGAVSFRLFSDGSRLTLTMPEQIAVALGDRIISGALEPGARIVEQDLAEEFSVSRGPVRDAIHLLEREGLVTILQRRGAIVTDLSADEVREIFEIRAGLIEIVARKNSLAQNPDLIAALKAGVAKLQNLARMGDDQGAYAETSYRLSIIAARACGNARLTRMIEALSLQTLRYAKLSLSSMARRKKSAAIWAAAVEAMEAGDVVRYMQLARERVEESGAEAQRILEKLPQSKSVAPRALKKDSS